MNTDWETQGPHLGSGLRVDLRFEYIEQETLRRGPHKARHAETETDHHEADDRHTEVASSATTPAQPLHEGDDHASEQLNLEQRARDKGENAEPDDSGSKFAYLSPGVQLRLGAATQAYMFLQWPLHQHVNGTQLTADKTLLLGLSQRF